MKMTDIATRKNDAYEQMVFSRNIMSNLDKQMANEPNPVTHNILAEKKMKWGGEFSRQRRIYNEMMYLTARLPLTDRLKLARMEREAK